MEVSAAELADLLGVSQPFVARLKKAGVVVALPTGKLSLRDAVRGYVKHLRDGQANAKVAAARAALLVQQEKKLRVENDLKAGRLADRAAVEAAAMQAAAIYVEGLSALPGRAAGEMEGMDAAHRKRWLEEEVRRIRLALFERLRTLAGDGEQSK